VDKPTWTLTNDDRYTFQELLLIFSQQSITRLHRSSCPEAMYCLRDQEHCFSGV